jgi:hypothetical protein
MDRCADDMVRERMKSMSEQAQKYIEVRPNLALRMPMISER